MPKCPNCKAEISEINYWESGQIEYDGNIVAGGWAFMQDRERNFQCPECFAPFNDEELAQLGVPAEMK